MVSYQLSGSLKEQFVAIVAENLAVKVQRISHISIIYADFCGRGIPRPQSSNLSASCDEVLAVTRVNHKIN